jgi:hypothetical protein
MTSSTIDAPSYEICTQIRLDAQSPKNPYEDNQRNDINRKQRTQNDAAPTTSLQRHLERFLQANNFFHESVARAIFRKRTFDSRSRNSRSRFFQISAQFRDEINSFVTRKNNFATRKNNFATRKNNFVTGKNNLMTSCVRGT